MFMTLPSPLNDHSQEFVSIREQIPKGDIIEFGVYQGGTTRQLASWGRRVWALDTYTGIPSEEYSEDNGDHDYPGKFSPNLSVWDMFKDYPNICPIKGRFADTLSVLPEVQIAFAYMDCDLYESYMQAFEWLELHLVKDSHVFIDDYFACAGCRKALHEWEQEKPIEYIPCNEKRKHFMWRSD